MYELLYLSLKITKDVSHNNKGYFSLTSSYLARILVETSNFISKKVRCQTIVNLRSVTDWPIAHEKLYTKNLSRGRCTSSWKC